MNEITIGDKIYISAKRAAEITGYARDYVGQLCREGHIDAKMVGRSWYVFEPSIRAHRFGAEEVEEPVEASVAADVAVPVLAENSPVAEDSWNRPTYTPEEHETLPEIKAPRIEELLPPAEETLTDMQAAWREWFDQKQKVLETPEIESPEVIDTRNEALEAEEEPEDTEEQEEDDADEEVSIPLHHIAEAPVEHHVPSEEEERVAIHHIAPPAAVSAPVYSYPSTPHMDIAPEPAPAYVPQPSYEAPIEHGRIIEERFVRPTTGKKGRSGKMKRSRGSNAPIIAVLIGISIVSITIAAIGTGYASRYLRTLPSKNNPAINFLIGTREFKR